MIAAFQKDDVLLAEIAAASLDENTLHVWWLGQSGFLVQWRGERMLFDPYLSDSLTKKYAQTDKPHVRLSERCIDPARLTGISRVTASHVHTDHLDGETLVPLAASNPGFSLYLPHAICPEALKRLQGSPVTLCATSEHVTHSEGEWTIRGTVAKHNEVVRDAAGNSHCIGFLVQCGPFRVFHSGDTLWHDDIIRQCRDFGPIDIAFLPINGNKPERRVAGNLDGIEAARLAKEIGAQIVIPCHYDLFEFNTASPDAFVAECERLHQPYQVLQIGERLDFDAQDALDDDGSEAMDDDGVGDE